MLSAIMKMFQEDRCYMKQIPVQRIRDISFQVLRRPPEKLIYSGV